MKRNGFPVASGDYSKIYNINFLQKMENLTKDRLVGEKTDYAKESLTGVGQHGLHKIQELESEVAKLREAANEANQYRSALDNCAFPVITLDSSEKITSFNAAAQKFWGYQGRQVYGQDFDMLLDSGVTLAYIREENRTSGNAAVNVLAQRQNGTAVPVEVSYTESGYGRARTISIFVNEVNVSNNAEGELQQLKDAIAQGYAVVYFTPEGEILDGNQMFCDIFGYTLEELKGRSHAMMCEKEYVSSGAWKRFWNEIGRGIDQNGDFKRIDKNGQEVWVTGSYNPMLDENGKVVRVLKRVRDLTERKVVEIDEANKLRAINTTMAAIEFDLTGHILTANDNFLATMGYRLDEIVGKHHRIFCDKEYINSKEYADFWKELARGEAQVGTFIRYAKDGTEVGLQANYNPIIDLDGKLIKVVKYAADTTDFLFGFKVSQQFIGEIAAGNLDADMDLNGYQFKGDIGKIVDNLLELREKIRGMLKEVNRVVEVAGVHGQLTERTDTTGLEGSWMHLMSGINNLLDSISKPIFQINEIAGMMAQGDLSRQLSVDAEGDIKTLANALNIAIKNIRGLLQEVQTNGLSVATSSAQLKDKGASIKVNSDEVSSAIQEMATGAHRQASKAEEASKLVDHILKSANEMKSVASQVIETSSKEQENCRSGLSTMQTLVSNMDEIKDSAEITSSTISALTLRSEEISRTLTVITDIAGQTNLLALNAAIEAARAGEAGRGFAVVAEEIRKLAEDSRRSAEDIDKVINDVQKDVASAAKAIEKMGNSVKGGSAATQDAENAFQLISTASRETFGLSKQVARSAEAQEADIDNIVKNIEEIVVVAEETASGTEEVASSSHSLTSSMEEINNTSNGLAKIAEELRDGLSKFKLSK